MLNTFGGRAGFDVNDSPLFPQEVLVVITLVWEGGCKGGGNKVGAQYEAGLLLCSMSITSLLGAVSFPKWLKQKP